MSSLTARSSRGLSLLASGFALSLALAACAPSGAQDPTSAPTSDDAANGSSEPGESAEPGGGIVKVGFLSPVTGPVAAAGLEMKEGWELYWDENGNTVGNVTVETIYEDDAAVPDTALAKAKRLVEEEGVDVVVGPLAANTALAVADYLIQQGIPNLHPITAADDLTQRLANPLVLRVGSLTGSQPNFVAGQWAYEEGHRTAITLCPDYAFGWESCGGFVRAFTEAGGEIVDQLWNPLGTQDFSPYVTQIGSSGADLAFVASSGGSDGTNFINAFTDFGLKDKVEVLSNCCLIDQSTLRDVGELAEGMKSVSYWAEGSDLPQVKAFVELYESKKGVIPSLNVGSAYTTAHVFAEALKLTDGKVDGTDFVAAARTINMEDSLFGVRSFDDFNNPVAEVYIRHVAKREDGAYWNVVDKTYENVSQFWTYDPEEFLKNPPFDRNNTGQQ